MVHRTNGYFSSTTKRLLFTTKANSYSHEPYGNNYIPGRSVSNAQREYSLPELNEPKHYHYNWSAGELGRRVRAATTPVYLLLLVTVHIGQFTQPQPQQPSFPPPPTDCHHHRRNHRSFNLKSVVVPRVIIRGWTTQKNCHVACLILTQQNTPQNSSLPFQENRNSSLQTPKGQNASSDFLNFGPRHPETRLYINNNNKLIARLKRKSIVYQLLN